MGFVFIFVQIKGFVSLSLDKLHINFPKKFSNFQQPKSQSISVCVHGEDDWNLFDRVKESTFGVKEREIGPGCGRLLGVHKTNAAEARFLCFLIEITHVSWIFYQQPVARHNLILFRCVCSGCVLQTSIMPSAVFGGQFKQNERVKNLHRFERMRGKFTILCKYWLNIN